MHLKYNIFNPKVVLSSKSALLNYFVRVYRHVQCTSLPVRAVTKTWSSEFMIQTVNATEIQSNPDLVTFKIVKNPDLVKILLLTDFLLIKNRQNSKF